VWTALGLCAVLVLGAMALLTRNVLHSQREMAMADARATLEEQTRLALWRMDAAGSAILLRENTWVFAAKGMEPEPPAKLHFEVRSGKLMSVDGSEEDLKKLQALLPKNGGIEPVLCHAVETGETAWQALSRDNDQLKQKAQVFNNTANTTLNRYDSSYQQDSNMIEQAQRAKVVEVQQMNGQMSGQNSKAHTDGSLPAESTGMRPVWLGGELILLRKAVPAAGEVASRGIQGAWLDAAAVRKMLLDEIPDLLPQAQLKPLSGSVNQPLALVSLPFLLDRGAVAQPPWPAWNGVLLAGWVAVVCALAAVAVLVRGVMRLSERRASFVSAVTHELRTPLTTFRLYSEMLESGAVKPEKRGDYLRVLSREADRLSHLVENVLAFSRIERGNARSNFREISAGDLLEQSRERLEARLATAGLRLEMETSCALPVRADTVAVEHILFNLIDNAAKYAAVGDDPVVEMRAEKAGRFVEIRVADHGPGIAECERRRIFRAFHKSAREAAESKPGVGLGLALSRRLAREQGGELEYRGSGKGACFVLRLPAA
jgi:signal transduction histidine kinase